MNTVITSMWWIAPIASVFALIFAVYFYKKMMSANEGNETMIEIAGHVRAGAMAYLMRQYKVVIIVFVVLHFSVYVYVPHVCPAPSTQPYSLVSSSS